VDKMLLKVATAITVAVLIISLGHTKLISSTFFNFKGIVSKILSKSVFQNYIQKAKKNVLLHLKFCFTNTSCLLFLMFLPSLVEISEECK